MSDRPGQVRKLFEPSVASLNWVIAIGLIALGYAIYVRYLVLEETQVGLACNAGPGTWLCLLRRVMTALYQNHVFGWVSLGAAVLAFIRPSLPIFTIGLAAAAFGVVLHDASLSGLAAAFLVMCFARPAVVQA